MSPGNGLQHLANLTWGTGDSVNINPKVLNKNIVFAKAVRGYKEEEVDDRIVMSGIYFDRENYADEVELHLNNYEIENRDGKTYAVFKNQETKISKPNSKAAPAP